MRVTTVAALFTAVFLIGSAQAQTPDQVVLSAMGEVAGELQICSVYYLVGSSCLDTQKPELARTYRAGADKLGNLAIMSGRAAGVSDAAYAAQSSLYAKAMMKAMDGNCTNIAVLLQRYSEFCQRLSQDADPRLKEWMACIRARNQTCGGPGLP
jgi:hypothetical protein